MDDVSNDELDQVGRSQNPYGSDPEERFVDVVAWTNTELAHHAAEIACLRDLYYWTDAAGDTSPSTRRG